jgi:hypothetical protein
MFSVSVGGCDLFPFRTGAATATPRRLPHKSIRVDASLAGEERLEVLLHELLHAAGWPIDEGFVTNFAADAAHVLWRLGYREHKP